MNTSDKRVQDKLIALDTLRSARATPVPPEDDRIARTHSPRPGAVTRQSTTTSVTPHASLESPQRHPHRTRSERSDAAGAGTLTSRMDKKWGLVGDMPFQDLLWICEQSFKKEASILGKEILGIARRELTSVSDDLLHDVRQPVQMLSDDVNTKLDSIQNEVEATAKVDWEPMRIEFRAQDARLDALERKLAEEMAVLRNGIQDLQQEQEKAVGSLSMRMGDVKGELEALQQEVVKRSDRQATQVLNVQQTLSAEAVLVSKEVRELQQEFRSTHDELFPRMETHFRRYVKEQPVNVNFEDVYGYVGNQTHVLLRNMKDLQGTMNNMKMQLHTDFEHKMNERQRDMDCRLQEIADTNKELFASVMRDSMCQTDPPPLTERSAQTDGKVLVPRKVGGKDDSDSKLQRSTSDKEAEEKKRQEKDKKIFADGEAMKKRARQALMKPAYCVAQYYHEKGYFQAVARHWLLEYLTFAVIFTNAIWIAVDIDNNEAAILIHAEPVFQIVEHLFCSYFTAELLIRFGAFKYKRDCLRDFWFVVDLVLVTAMILDTWVLTLVFALTSSGKTVSIDVSIVKMFRMARMVRLSRMAKLLQAIPELVVLVKAVGAAVRSMAIFFLLWVILIYIFAVVFRQLTDGQKLGMDHFPDVVSSMNTLLLQGILPQNANILTAVTDEHLLYWPLMMMFILLSAITLMFMLIGVLTEVIHLVAQTEKEGMIVQAVAARLRTAFQSMGWDEEEPLTKMNFQELMVQPDVAQLCTDVGVNVVVLIDMSDVIFEGLEKELKGMSFEKLVEVVLNMRGTNPATVKDVKEQLRVIKGFFNDSQQFVLSNVHRGLEKLGSQLQELRKIMASDEDEDSGPE
mmetsp:Transcript_53662/g.166586  ORF Transcript_53662/g.166586 Transcript_53662/m.166586 type:complete len:855 (-) Transcript_53662:52-2616(-)